VRALGNIESATSRAYLVSAFRDPDAGVRTQAAITLAAKPTTAGRRASGA